MFLYSLFGGCLRSTMPLSGLRPGTHQPPRWEFAQSTDSTSEFDGFAPASAIVSCTVELQRGHDGFRLYHSCAGVYDISASGDRILWHSAPHATADSVRNDLANRVLALALHAAGVPSLHGSAVAWGHQAVAFLADKGVGKSTLAIATVCSGARLVSDDTLAVSTGDSGQAVLLPGVPYIRLRDDSVIATLGAAGKGTHEHGQRGEDGKLVLSELADEQLQLDPIDLRTIYLLMPGVAGGEDALRRERLSTVDATLALLRHLKLAPLLGNAETAKLLEACGSIAQRVPVYALRVTRELGRLNEAAAMLREWHLAEHDGNPAS